MPFDDKKFYAAAQNADVASLAINLSLAISNIAFALEALRDSDPKELDENIASIRKIADDLDKLFTDLTGYTPK